MFLNSNLEILGAARQTWTDDQRINSPTLYHAELGRHKFLPSQKRFNPYDQHKKWYIVFFNVVVVDKILHPRLIS